MCRGLRILLSFCMYTFRLSETLCLCQKCIDERHKCKELRRTITGVLAVIFPVTVIQYMERGAYSLLQVIH